MTIESFVDDIKHHFDVEFFDRACREKGHWLRRLVKNLIIINAKVSEQLQGKQVLYISNHRSHFDYLQQMYLFRQYRFPIPRIAARENVFIPLFAEFFKKCGAFKMPIRKMNLEEARSMDSYLEKEIILSRDSCLDYAEGGRSNPGEIRTFKTGGIKVFHRVAKDKGIDITILPIYIDYDYAIEDRVLPLTRFLKPRSQVLYKLTDLTAFAIRLLYTQGTVLNAFGEPFSILECKKREKVCERARTSILEMQAKYRLQ